MDGMAFLVAAVAFVLALVALNKLAKIETRLAQFKIELGNLGAQLGRLQAADLPPAPAQDMSVERPQETIAASGNVAESPAVAEEPAVAKPAAEPAVPAATEQQPVPPPPARPPRDMEQALASRWFVWIGGVAIAIGGLLFIKYAYDNGLISPSLQIVLGLIIGFALIASGEWLRRKAFSVPVQPTSYVPAALSAAGLAIVFAAIYAADALYQLIAPAPAFFGLALTGLGALALSRRQGPLIAALGLLGSYVTPAMIPSQEPSGWTFFPYLLVVLFASFLSLRGRNWWWLGFAAAAGSFLWAALWIYRGIATPSEIWPTGLFANLIGLVSFFGVGGLAILRDDSGRLTGRPALTPPLLIGLAGLAAQTILLCFLVKVTHHETAALILLFAGLLFVVALGWLKHGLSPLAPIAGLTMFAVLMAWTEAAFHEFAMDEQGIWTWSNNFGSATTYFMRWMLISGAVFTFAGVANVIIRSSPRSFGVLGGASAFLFVWGAWARTDFLLTENMWALTAAVFAAVLLAGALQANRRIAEEGVDFAAGALAAGAAALLVLALDRLFDRIWLTIAVAALAFAYAVLSRILKPRLMGPVTAALAALTTLRLFASRELWLDDRTLPLGQHWALYGYGVPALLLYGGSRLLRGAGHPRSAVALEGISLGLLISLVALELRVLIAGNVVYEHPEFLEMATHILTWLGAAYGLMHRQRLFSSLVALWGARVLAVISVISIVAFSLVLLNPVFTGHPVPGNIAFNALLLAYLAPAILVGLIALRLDVLGWRALRPAAGLLVLFLAFVYVTEQTKRMFQGKIMMLEPLSVAESYAYSAVWLAFALALFVAGIRMSRKHIRLAGLGVMALVVLKVFAWDMSGLEGLYRIASFIGLGLCLVGIGWLYQRFVQRPELVAS